MSEIMNALAFHCLYDSNDIYIEHLALMYLEGREEEGSIEADESPEVEEEHEETLAPATAAIASQSRKRTKSDEHTAQPSVKSQKTTAVAKPSHKHRKSAMKPEETNGITTRTVKVMTSASASKNDAERMKDSTKIASTKSARVKPKATTLTATTLAAHDRSKPPAAALASFQPAAPVKVKRVVMPKTVQPAVAPKSREDPNTKIRQIQQERAVIEQRRVHLEKRIKQDIEEQTALSAALRRIDHSLKRLNDKKRVE